MGPYCQYCDHRCFVPNPRKSGYLLATCHHGQEHDKDMLGYCYSEILDEVVKRKVEMTFYAIGEEDLDTHVSAQLTKREQDAIWHILYGADPVAIGSAAAAQDEPEPPQPTPGFQSVEYRDYEICGPYAWASDNVVFLVFPKGGQVAVFESPLATACKRWIDEEAP